MSQSIEVYKSVVVDTHEADVSVEIDVNFVNCDCGAALDFTLAADRFGDIQINVEEHECVQKESEDD